MERTFSATNIRMDPSPSHTSQTHSTFRPDDNLSFRSKCQQNYVLILSWPRTFFPFIEKLRSFRPWILLQFFDLIIKSSYILCVCVCEGVCVHVWGERVGGCARGRVEEFPDIKFTGRSLLTLASFHSFPWNCAFPDRIFSHLAINRSMFFCLDIIDAISGHF